MTTKRRRTDADYEAAAAYYAVEPPRSDENGTIEFGPAYVPIQAATDGQVDEG